MVEQLKIFFTKFSRNKHFKYGIPFACLVGIGWYIVKESQSVRYDLKPHSVSLQDLKDLGCKVKDKPETLEEVYESVKKIDIDNWENIRGPRLWEETPQN